MTSDEIKGLRTELSLTQSQFAQLLGVHQLTVWKWEHDKLQPQPYQAGLMQSFQKAAKASPDMGNMIANALVGAGIGMALFILLKAAFGKK